MFQKIKSWTVFTVLFGAICYLIVGHTKSMQTINYFKVNIINPILNSDGVFIPQALVIIFAILIAIVIYKVLRLVGSNLKTKK